MGLRQGAKPCGAAPRTHFLRGKAGWNTASPLWGSTHVDLHIGGADQRHSRRALGVGLAVTAAGLLLSAAPAFAQDAQTTSAAGAQIPDPWEPMNRALFSFTMTVDRAVIAPGIHLYRRATPEPVQTGIRNVVYNLYEPRTFANDMLQGRFEKAGETTVRFVANSTAGLGGLIDVAGKTGLPGHDPDFGQTLGRWGFGTGPYIFVPFYGPSDLRDGIGKVTDALGDPVSWTIGDIRTTTFGRVRAGVNVLQARVDLDDQLEGMRRDFTDPYATLRSAYSQNRAFKVQEAKGVTPAAQAKDLPDFGADTLPAKP